MNLVGITGGVGMGKSTAQSILAERSIPVVDTDELARLLVQPGQPALEEIAMEFGPAVLTAEGHLDRGAMANRVFNDADARARLESILHPRIRSHWEAEVERWQRAGTELGAVVIPLLFETDVASSFKITVCVACSPETQLRRLQARGWSGQQIQQRLAAQWPVDRKMAASDHVVWTDGSLEVHARQWERILHPLPSR